METCNDCKQAPEKCICAAVDKFFDENRHLMDDLAERGTHEHDTPEKPAA